jgi:hypothetical protein
MTTSRIGLLLSGTIRARTKQLGQENWTGQYSQEKNEYRIARTRQLEEDYRYRKAWTRQQGQDVWDRIFGTEQPGQVNQDRTARTGPLGQNSWTGRYRQERK